MQKVWNVKSIDDAEAERISLKYKISDILAKLLIARNVSEDKIDEFLNGDLNCIKDPFLIKDMQIFVDRVLKAKENNEKICIYGDYDVDGITSIAIMYKFLTNLGMDVTYYLPDRLIEGYGLNKEAIEKIKDTGVSLIITVDCAITAVEEVEFANSLNIDMLITDHHECAQILPNALAVINPKRSEDTSEFKFHAGVGVAFKCLMALSKTLNLPEEEYLKYLDIVAIGTISDIVSLVDENRIISKYGLQRLEKTENIGLQELLSVISYKSIDSTMVSFSVAPRINACGRMGNASIAVKLLLETDRNKAKEYALALDKLNLMRQQVEKDIFEQAVALISEKKLDKRNSIVLYNESWHNGVIGIVASRLVNLYYKPVILLTKENGKIRGSGRCQMGFSLYEALSECQSLLAQFGGHELAAGLTIEEENIKPFYELFDSIVEQNQDKEVEQIVDIDLKISKKDINVKLIKDIYALRPFGQDNKVPLFLYKNLKVQAIRTLKEDKHLKLTLKDNTTLFEAMAFSQGDRRDEIRIGDKIDVVCNVEINTYTTPKTIQLIVQDFKKSI